MPVESSSDFKFKIMRSEKNEVDPKVNGTTTGDVNTNTFNESDTNVDSESNKVKTQDDAAKHLNGMLYVYRRDIVRHNKSGIIGIVNEVAGDSVSDSSLTEEEGDDQNEGEDVKGGQVCSEDAARNLQAGQIRVSWMNHTNLVQHINDVTVIDRWFLPGDGVASSSDPTGQVGVVQDVHVYVDLLAPDGFIIKNVSSRDLRRVREFSFGDFVVLGRWLGIVYDVSDTVTVLVDDGSVCQVTDAEPLRLKPISNRIFDEDDHFPYYPGQRVRASSPSVYKSFWWLPDNWRANKLEGTVKKVTTGSVYIDWIGSAGFGPAPAEEQNSKNLKLCSHFAHAFWQVGDFCLLSNPISKLSSNSCYNDLSKLGLHDPMKRELDSNQQGNVSDSDEHAEELDGNNESMDIGQANSQDVNAGNINNNETAESKSTGSSTLVSKEHVNETWPLCRKKIYKGFLSTEKRPPKKEENFEKGLFIVNMRTTVDVVWQDGTTECGVNSAMLILIDNPGDHEFVAEQYVVEKASDDIGNSSEARRVGVVKSVNAKEKTACVRWLKPVARAEDPREFDKEEIVSVYELEGHPDYDHSYGDVIVRECPVSVPAQTTSDRESVTEHGPNDVNTKKCSGCKKGEDASSSEAFETFSDLSWVGYVSGLKNGDIEVTWADGTVSTVAPQEIIDDRIAAGSQDIELQNAANVNCEAQESMGSNNSGRNSALSFPLAAFDFVTRLASGIFSWGRKNVDPDYSESKDANELHSQGMSYSSDERDSINDLSSQKFNVADGAHREEEENNVTKVPISEHSEEVVCNSRTTSDMLIHLEDDACNFKRFDTATDPLDHYFIGSNAQVNNGRKWLKKVQQDWNMLRNNLPDGIYVRVYEDRMDLLRAVITGAYGTPYQDGLFFFDFHLPPEYPDVPPSAYYHSGGWRINPNLYADGKVCLSLLNTWTGKENEVWDPATSGILQVLVSLQGLVLNSRPYFNEPGYDKLVGTAEGEKNSQSYNENTFLLNCKTMMYLMRKPHKDFEELIKEHFRRRGRYILKACDAYMKDSLIGSLTKDACVSNEGSSNLTSVGFKLMLIKIMPKLYHSLEEVGADCHEFRHML